MRLFIKKILLVLFICCYWVNLYADTDEEFYLELRDHYNALKQDKKRRLYRVHWSRISSQLKRLSENADPKLKVRIYFTLGELYRELRKISLSPYDFESAIEYYKKVYSEFQDSNLADDALFFTGKLYLEVENDPEKAITFFEKIRRLYPKGDYFEKASTILNSMGYSDYQVASAKSIKEKPSRKEEEPQSQKDDETTATHDQKSIEIATLEDVVLKIGEDGAICEIILSNNVRYLYKELPEDKKSNKPPRIYVDLVDTKMGGALENFKTIDKGFIKAVRMGQFADNTVRIVFDLISIKSYLIFVQENPYKIVVQFGDATTQTEMVVMGMRQTEQVDVSMIPSKTKTASEIGQKEIKEDEDLINVKVIESVKGALKKNISEKRTDSIPLSKQLGLKVKKIVIDPGHGGEDYGAIGRGGLKEKDVALDIALELARIIRKNSDIEVILTRESDITLKLSERAALARERKADLFISIHANANKNRRLSGVEVYYLNNTDDRASQRVAMLENINSDKSISDLKMTLLDLAMSANVDESMRLAHYVQKAIISTLKGKYPDVKDRGVKYALFYVLFGTDVPSILVETSFISNPLEEKRLRSREYKRLIAEGIFKGIMQYIKGTEE